MQRRELLAAGACSTFASLASLSSSAAYAAAPKRLRTAFIAAEVGFDAPQVSDNSSLTIVDLIFEAPLAYDALASPAQLVPLTAAALPVVSADFRHFVFTIRPGILFADDPVFKGRPRELTAADYVYSVKRFYDPALKSERLYLYENARLLGLSELRKKALAARSAFDYDTEVDGLRALDRYRFEVRLAAPAPRFVHVFGASQNAGAVAREVVEAYAADLMAHPVGTGPYRLAEWRRSSRIVLERNPRFRELRFDSVAPAGDAEAVSTAHELAGRRLPLVDRIEVSVIEESQPRWLAFVGGEIDTIRLPPAFAPLAMPGGKLAPYLAKRGVHARRTLSASVTHTYFNFDDPQVGGYTPVKIALRRAIALGCDNAADIRLFYNGQALPAQSMIPPHNVGFDPALKSEMSEASPARANALLDLYGYARGGDGWRRHPGGQALLLRRASSQDQRSRQLNELWQKRMHAIGLRIVFEIAPFGELIKRSLAGQLQMWGFNWSQGPDGEFFLGLAYGPNAEQSNDARFRLPAFDALYQRQSLMSDGPERLAVMHEATRLMLAYVPYIAHVHPIETDLSHAHVKHLIRHPFKAAWWHFTDVE
ncbi:MAG: ABC transporter substrate-binding protein [Pseudomonadota bacterium]